MLSITGSSAVPKLAPPATGPALLTSAYNCCSRQGLERMKQVREMGLSRESRRGRRASQKRSPGRVRMNRSSRPCRSLQGTLLGCQTPCGYAFEPHRRSILHIPSSRGTGRQPHRSCPGTALCAMVHRLVKLRTKSPVRTPWACGMHAAPMRPILVSTYPGGPNSAIWP